MRYLLASVVLVLSNLWLHGVSGSKTPPGFVTTSGTKFELDGKPFAFVGANSYWLPLLTSKEDVRATFREMQASGVKVLRTWGFNAINGSELAGALETGLTYYQVWNSSEWVLNDGPQGLERLDFVIQTAAEHDIKVILAFTNNWVGYGGSELYVNWIAGAGNTHDVFYSDRRIVTSYQRYVKTIVDRYKNSPTIFAWELVNEARCLGDLPNGPNCVPGTELISKWYKEQSDFVRSLDPLHLITTGGEGQFFWRNATGALANDNNFNGAAGEDFDLDLTLENIDFGTYHLYPQSWYANLDFPGSNFSAKQWGLDWISLHAESRVGKPVILEEFGLLGLDNKTVVYPEWVGHALNTHTAIMPWQFGMLGLKEHGGNHLFKYADALINGASPNDGLAIYENQTEVWNIFKHAAQVQASRSG
ncbi:glycoside hydrolase [Dendrothele bispora CBS 962.96]|uniref:mannan endo-1,4-beta-mannosidase n=1 Tax=Dendrothele bispora (strain CBS 962.96) TaxID=1314807 RepID=A0A4V4HI15_DENBC|nr:glycoside hydrolase [Dendrothele bispora CBS 962.96]